MLHHFCPQHAGCIQLAAVCCAESCDGSVASLIGKQPVVEKKCPDTENSASSDTGAFFHCMVFGFKESRNVHVHEASNCTSNCEKKGVGPPDFNVKAVWVWGSTGLVHTQATFPATQKQDCYFFFPPASNTDHYIATHMLHVTHREEICWWWLSVCIIFFIKNICGFRRVYSGHILKNA